MHALVVYETSFGNTEAVARAVAEGLATRATVQVVDAATAPESLAGVDLAVVGGPTHAFGLSRVSTRQDARRRGASRGDVERGLREWLAELDAGPRTTSTAAFDTKVSRPRLPGSAARRAHRRLRRLGLAALARPRTFRVSGTEGPLRDGELDRAREWGRELAAQWGPRRGRASRGGARRRPSRSTEPAAPPAGVTAFDAKTVRP
jgi:hypothetical protein